MKARLAAGACLRVHPQHQRSHEDPKRRAEREAERAAAQRLIDNAGVDGWDDDGKRLDQREFEETRKALQWLATCHMGHYRHDDRPGETSSRSLNVISFAMDCPKSTGS